MHFGWMTIFGIFALFGVSVAFFIMLAAVPVLIYACCARRGRRGLIASRIALWVAGAAVAMSVPFWIVEAMLRLDGNSFFAAEPNMPPYGVFSVVALGLAVLAFVVWRWRRRAAAVAGEAAGPVSSRP